MHFRYIGNQPSGRQVFVVIIACFGRSNVAESWSWYLYLCMYAVHGNERHVFRAIGSGVLCARVIK
jgi:hypothetical protein